MATLYIDDRPHTFEEGQNLLQTCLSLGYDLPYFCWHPALGSVGACRQCAVKQFKDENDREGELIMACMTPATDGARISINDPEAVQFRAGIIELLMLNHPHDCPVCDEGGECHLQDMTVMTGHHHRRTRFPKRTHRNQDLGPFIHHEMNRCIQCYRCVRFYRDYAGGRDVNAFACGNDVYFGRYAEGPLESPFSGNLVEVCPTGVFTDKTLRSHFTRKWDLQSAPSICVHCGLGCNTLAGERSGTLRRIRNRYHHQVNGYFLCDRGRFGYDFVNSPRRIRAPLSRIDGSAKKELPKTSDVIDVIRPMMAGQGRVIGIGSPRASLEANFALRTLVGASNFFGGLAPHENDCMQSVTRILERGPTPAVTLQGAGLCDAVVILGEDVVRTAPMLGLSMHRLRFRRGALAASGFQLPAWNDAAVLELAQLQKNNLFILAAAETGLDDEAQHTCHVSPSQVVRTAAALDAAIRDPAAEVSGIDTAARRWVTAAADALRKARRPLVIAGVSYGRPTLIEAAANIAWRLTDQGKEAALAFCLPECNSLGLTLMGPHDLTDALEAATRGEVHTVIVLENDLYRRAEAPAVDAFLAAAHHVIALDHTATATTDKAHLVLPSATFAEAAATLVNNEGRSQRSYAAMPAIAPVRAAWRWLQAMRGQVEDPEVSAWQTIEDVARSLAAAMPVFQPILEMNLLEDASMGGMGVPRQTHRRTGRTALTAHRDIHEPAPPQDGDAPMTFSMEGWQGQPPAQLIPRYWAPGWNSVQALNKFQVEVGGPLRGGDPGRRLLAAAHPERTAYFELSPPVSSADIDTYEVVPVHHVFGSDFLSMSSPAIAASAPEPYVGLSLDDPLAHEGCSVSVQCGTVVATLPVKGMPAVAPHAAALPVGLPGMPFVTPPQSVRIVRDERKKP